MPKHIPIATAKRVAEAHDLSQVILLAWDGERTHVVTYGKSAQDCDQAAQGGDRIKAALGWTDTVPVLPSRVQALTKRAEAAEVRAQAAETKLLDLELQLAVYEAKAVIQPAELDRLLHSDIPDR